VIPDNKLIDTLLQLKRLRDIKCDVPGFKGILEPHQRVGVAFLILAKRAMCLDFVGAGKTVEVIACDLKLRDKGHVRRTLIACLGSTRHHWAKLYKQFSDIPTYVIEGDKKTRINNWLGAQGDTAATIANYESIRADLPSLIRNGVRLNWDMIVWDEATVFKSEGTVLAESLRMLLDHVSPEYVFGLTATPIQKRLEDLFCVMEKIRPGLLGSDFYEFQDRYVIRRQFKTKSARGRMMSFWKTIGYMNEGEVGSTIQPYFIRRTKDEVYEGRTKRLIQEREVDLSDKQRVMYDEVRQQVKQGTKSAFTGFLDLEKISDTLQWYDKTSDVSAKIDDLMFLLENDLVDEKVVVFSKHKQPLYHLMGRLNKAGIKSIEFTGDVSSKDGQREANRIRFQEDDSVRVALVTSAAEMGVEFHSARYMIFLNIIVNHARIEQIMGRIDRPIVQRSPFVCYIFYIARHTHEERMHKLMKEESELSDKIFGKGDEVTRLGEAELRKLILGTDD